MNRTTSYNRNIKVIPYQPNKRYAYPNQKSSRYYIDKFIDYTLAFITGAGAMTALVFILTL